MSSRTKRIKNAYLDLITIALPKSFYEIMTKDKVKGSVAIQMGIFEIDGKKIDPDSYYIYGMQIPQPLNHKRRLGKLYDKHGEKCLTEYLKWFKPHHDKMVKKYPTLFTNISNSELHDKVEKFL